MTCLALWRVAAPVLLSEIEEFSDPPDTWPAAAAAAVQSAAKVKISREPGLTLWETTAHKKKVRGFVDHAKRRIVCEVADHKIVAKALKALEKKPPTLSPAQVDKWLCEALRAEGGAQVVGDLWIVPEGALALLERLQSLPSISVARIPITTGEALGELLIMIVARVTEAAAEATAGIETAKRSTLRRRSKVLGGHAQDLARIAAAFGPDLTAVGKVLLEADEELRKKLGSRRRPLNLRFDGGSRPAAVAPVPPEAPPELSYAEVPDIGDVQILQLDVPTGEMPDKEQDLNAFKLPTNQITLRQARSRLRKLGYEKPMSKEQVWAAASKEGLI